MTEYGFNIDKKQIIQKDYNGLSFFNNTKLGKILGSIFDNNIKVENSTNIGMDVLQKTDKKSSHLYFESNYPKEPEIIPTPFNEPDRFITRRSADRYKTQFSSEKIIKYDSEGKLFSESVKIDNQNLIETKFFDNEGFITCKVLVAEGDILKSAEFYDKTGKVISKTNEEGETLSQNGSNVKLYFDPVSMCVSRLCEIETNTGKTYRELSNDYPDINLKEYDIQTGEELFHATYRETEGAYRGFSKTESYVYDSENGKGYIYKGNEIKETIEYDSETGSVLKRITYSTENSIVREYDPKTGKEIKRTDTDSYGDRYVSEYDSLTGKKIKYTKYLAEEEDYDIPAETVEFMEEYFYDKETGNLVKEIKYSDLYDTEYQELEYNPVTKHRIKETVNDKDGSHSWIELNNLGKKIRGEDYNADGSMESKTDYESNPKTGLVTKVIKYDANNNITSYSTYEYNTDTGITKISYFNSENRLEKEEEYNNVTKKCTKSTTYNEEGAVSDIKEYDFSTGIPQKQTIFNSDGSINKEVKFTKSAQHSYYSAITTEYNSDGTQKVLYHDSTTEPSFDILKSVNVIEEFNSDGSIRDRQCFGAIIIENFKPINPYNGSDTSSYDLLPKIERTVTGSNSFEEKINGISYEVRYENNQLKIKQENKEEQIIDVSEFSKDFIIKILMRVNSKALYEIAKEHTAIKWASLRSEVAGVYVSKSNTLCLNRNLCLWKDDVIEELIRVIGHECGHLFDSVDNREIAIKNLTDNSIENEANLSMEELLEKHGTRVLASRVDQEFINTANEEINKAFPIKNSENAKLPIKERVKKEYLTDWDLDSLYGLTSTDELFAEAYNLLTSGDCMSAALLCNYFPEILKLVKERIEQEQ